MNKKSIGAFVILSLALFSLPAAAMAVTSSDIEANPERYVEAPLSPDSQQVIDGLEADQQEFAYSLIEQAAVENAQTDAQVTTMNINNTTSSSYNDIMLYALKYRDMPYQWAGKDLTRDGSFDCSGLVNWVYNHKAGMNIDSDYTSAATLYSSFCTPVSEENAQPGDIVFFNWTYGSKSDYITHVGIYCGDGYMYNAGDPIGFDPVNVVNNKAGVEATRIYGRLVTLSDTATPAKTISSKSNTGLVADGTNLALTVANASNVESGAGYLYTPTGTDNQEFTVKYNASSGYYNITCDLNDKALVPSYDGKHLVVANVDSDNSYQDWIAMDDGDGAFTLRNRLTMEDIGYTDSSPVNGTKIALVVPGSSKAAASKALHFEYETLDVDVIDISSAVLNIASVCPTGKALTPAVQISYNGCVLDPGDFKISYSDNVEIGTGKVAVSSNDDLYTGTATGTFPITMTRYAGSDRYETMSDVVTDAETLALFQESDYVVIASGISPYDALAASGFAGVIGAPVVTVNPTYLTYESADALSALQAKHAIVLGGTSAISDHCAEQVAAYVTDGDYTRIAGDNRYETALKIYEKGWRLSTGYGDVAFLVSGTNVADALSAAPYAYALQAPVFLAGSDGTVDDDTLKSIKDGGFDRLIIVGGTAVVSEDTEDELEDELDGTDVDRLSGEDRFLTSVEVSEDAVDTGVLSYYRPMYAAGANGSDGQIKFADSLGSAAAAGINGRILVLVDEDASNGLAGVKAVSKVGVDPGSGAIVGGTAAISDDLALTICEM